MHPELQKLGWDTILKKGEVYNNCERQPTGAELIHRGQNVDSGLKRGREGFQVYSLRFMKYTSHARYHHMGRKKMDEEHSCITEGRYTLQIHVLTFHKRSDISRFMG